MHCQQPAVLLAGSGAITCRAGVHTANAWAGYSASRLSSFTRAAASASEYAAHAIAGAGDAAVAARVSLAVRGRFAGGDPASAILVVEGNTHRRVSMSPASCSASTLTNRSITLMVTIR